VAIEATLWFVAAQEIYKIVSTKGLDEMATTSRPDTITVAPSSHSKDQGQAKGCC
jgi:hypothetical protein